LNIVHFSRTNIEHCSFNPEELKMQTLTAEIAFTFVDDAMALMTGGVRIFVRFLMSPIERLASACDVAGVLASRRRARWHGLEAGSPRHRLFAFHRLNHLT
jgi:hypothetical protein